MQRRKLKILQFLPYLPYPPSNGGRVRSLNLLRHLANKYSFDLACYIKPGEEKNLEHLQGLCNRIFPIPRHGSPNIKTIRNLSRSFKPILVNFFDSHQARNILYNILSKNEYNVIHIETNYIAHSLFMTLEKKVPVVIVESNIESDLALQFAKYANRNVEKVFWMLDSIKQRFWERKIWKNATRCAAVTPTDTNRIAEIIGANKVDLVENGAATNISPIEYSKPIMKRILFVGSFFHRPNIDGIIFFIKNILPLIKREHNDVILDIIGENPPKEICSTYNSSNIYTFGYVDNLRPFYEMSILSICPIRIAGGSRIKILEALAYGHPMVSTKIGCSGLELVDQEHLLLADTPMEFATAVCKLIASPELRAKIGMGGRLQLQKKYDWQYSAAALSDCYHKAFDCKQD